MKTLRLHAVGDLRLHDEPVPEPNPGEALIRVTSVGICGSDVHWYSESGIGDTQLTKPLVLGHEFSGLIETAAEDTDSLPVGSRVAVDPAIPCQVCEFCREGNPNLCESLRFAGHGLQDGALQQAIAWPNRCLHLLPDRLTEDDGAMLEPLGVAIHAVDLAHIKTGMTVGVFGCGPIGLLILQVARLAGATRLIATDKLPHRLAAACDFGALGFQVTENEAAGEILKAVGPHGVDVAFEVAGDNAALETAIATVRPGGRVVLVGIPPDDRTSFTASTARRKGLTIAIVRRMKSVYPRAIRFVADGLVDVRSLVTNHFLLDESVQAFRLAQQREGIKIMIHP